MPAVLLMQALHTVYKRNSCPTHKTFQDGVIFGTNFNNDGQTKLQRNVEGRVVSTRRKHNKTDTCLEDF